MRGQRSHLSRASHLLSLLERISFVASGGLLSLRMQADAEDAAAGIYHDRLWLCNASALMLRLASCADTEFLDTRRYGCTKTKMILKQHSSLIHFRFNENESRTKAAYRSISFLYNYVCHNYIGHNYIGHNCIGHDYLGHNVVGHNYLGHN